MTVVASSGDGLSSFAKDIIMTMMMMMMIITIIIIIIIMYLT